MHSIAFKYFFLKDIIINLFFENYKLIYIIYLSLLINNIYKAIVQKRTIAKLQGFNLLDKYIISYNITLCQ